MNRIKKVIIQGELLTYLPSIGLPCPPCMSICVKSILVRCKTLHRISVGIGFVIFTFLSSRQIYLYLIAWYCAKIIKIKNKRGITEARYVVALCLSQYHKMFLKLGDFMNFWLAATDAEWEVQPVENFKKTEIIITMFLSSFPRGALRFHEVRHILYVAECLTLLN